ncbi:MAG: hypothetical protein Q7U89_06830 [Coriobacteriia bacterium]|nr:hypothetical protein [Coriobacteriia bacterium]
MDMQRDRQNYALQTIFSFFLGLMVLAFVGIGVNTFYESPDQKNQPELDKLYRQQEQINRQTGGKAFTPAQEAENAVVQKKIDALQKDLEAKRQIWARNTSIVLIVFATFVMGISLIRSEQLRVISNGLLLGGLLTMIYGSGWVIFSGQSTARFAVIVFAFAVTLALGYLKFARQHDDVASPDMAQAAVSSTPPTSDLDGLTARVDALERRAAAAAAALGADVPANE